MRRLLCVRRGGLGDTLLMLPVLRAMRARVPRATLTFAGVADHARVLQRFGVVDAVVSSEALALWALAGSADAAARARARLESYDWIVGDDPALSNLEGPRAPAPGAAGLLDRGVASPCPVVSVFDPHLDATVTEAAAAVLLGRAGLSGPVDVDFALPRAPLSAAAPIVLHAGSGAPRKSLPPAALGALAHALAGRGPLAVVLGPAEVERGVDADWPPAACVVRSSSIDALVDLLRTARVFVGHDSGPTHLAAALRVPTCALFLATDPRVWAPPGEHVRVLAGVASVAAVVAAVDELGGG
ncbi:MAG: glycosyltransferase family 9 protein [Planctomycetota bacterium]